MSIDLLALINSWVSDKFVYLMDNEKFSFPYIYGWIWVGMSLFWLGVGKCDLLGAGWGWMWMSVGGCGLVWPFLGWVWIGIGACDLFLAGCGWVWVSVTFFGWVWVSVTFFVWVWVGVGECELFLAGCGWMWVYVSVDECRVYNCPNNILKFSILNPKNSRVNRP